MSNYKLIAIDLDDTLLNTNLTISPRNKEYIQRAKDAGIHITLATGRMYCSALPYAKELGLNLPLITYQGALVKEIQTDEILIHRPVPLDPAREVIQRCRQLGYHINVYVNDTLYVEKMSPEAAAYQKISGIPAHPVGDLLEFLKEAPTKVLLVGSSEKLDELEQEMTKQYSTSLHICKSKPHFLEFSHPQATKGHALDTLAKDWGLTPDQIIAIGDAPNDLEMLQYAGLGVAMSNGDPTVQALADYITSSNDHDGVAEVIEKFVFGF
ncbi:Cof-type HAD-IIB family hydrolase [Desulfotomaculum sp. 1211_IL3151]|uniref:Cof-type HAD-IIB family hydrolase n=1 Tax=Desulfotomaculum sp. 1211_IL3151 TaxID=3084055 RepID=UPI002FD8985B